MRANLPFGLPTAGPQPQHQKLIREWGLDSDIPKVPRKGNPQVQQQKPVKAAQAQQHTGKQPTMSKKKTIKEIQEGGLASVRAAAKKDLSSLIKAMNCQDDSLSIYDIINSCEKVLDQCKDRLQSGKLSSDYTETEIIAQRKEINSLSDRINEHAHNLFECADKHGFAFLG